MGGLIRGPLYTAPENLGKIESGYGHRRNPITNRGKNAKN